MIYFGWDSWGPFHSWSGSIWFFAGYLFCFLFMMVGAASRDAGARWKDKFLTMGLVLSIAASSAALGGYYGWFNGTIAQLGQCQADLNKRRADDLEYTSKLRAEIERLRSGHR